MNVFAQFFEPNWKKLGWFFLVFLVAQVYFAMILGAVPNILANFVGFVLNPATVLIESFGSGVDSQLTQPFAITLNAAWNYLIACVLANETNQKK
ncbi:MAG: hypothetical protein NTZ73_00930 [Candidatus Diapherotrites archaeon]|nr:hypothetical protein [Candidatus Diapherotrites archaeon]